MRLTIITSIAVLTASAAFAQDAAARKGAIEAMARVPFEKAFPGAPYSAETVTEGVQVLADGNRIVRKTTGRVYRDTEGRTRREQDEQYMSNVRTGNQASVVRMTGVAIVDPIGGYSYSLNPVEKIAWRTPIGASAAISDAVKYKIEAARVEANAAKVADEKAAAGVLAPAEEQKIAEARPRVAAGGGGRGGTLSPAGTEVRMRGNAEAYNFAANPGPLERKTMEGILVEGRKTTTVIPAGQVGNEQPLTIVSEEWRSPELGVLVLTRHLDPRTGESTYRLTNILRGEPESSLFTVPPDYEIRDTGVRRMLDQK